MLTTFVLRRNTAMTRVVLFAYVIALTGLLVPPVDLPNPALAAALLADFVLACVCTFLRTPAR